jgi:uncharacterized membrane protein (UPF0182 family)
MGDTFLYVDPIYIQATEARMPQLKKVVLAVGNRLIYKDTYEEALAQLAGGAPPPAETPSAAVRSLSTGAPGAPAAAAGSSTAEARLQRIREHVRKYNEFAAQGRWAEAGKELEAIEAEVKQ